MGLNAVTRFNSDEEEIIQRNEEFTKQTFDYIKGRAGDKILVKFLFDIGLIRAF